MICLLQVDVTEIVMPEAYDPDALVDFFNPDALTRSDGRDIDPFAMHADASAGGHYDVAIMQRIGDVWRTAIRSSWTWWPGRMRSMAMPSRNHQRDSLERLNNPFELANGTPLSEHMAAGRPRSRNRCSNAVIAVSSRVDSSASHSSR